MSTSGNWNAGTWAITPSNAVGTDLDNYSITYIDGASPSHPRPCSSPASRPTSKPYDGTTTATIDATNAAIQSSDVVTGDDVGLNASAATGQFASPDVGTQTVIINGLVLTGDRFGDYTPTTDVTADITQANLTITANDVNSTYGDGTTLDGDTGFTATGLMGTTV